MAVAEFEREIIRERVKAGLAAARRRGVIQRHVHRVHRRIGDLGNGETYHLSKALGGEFLLTAFYTGERKWGHVSPSGSMLNSRLRLRGSDLSM